MTVDSDLTSNSSRERLLTGLSIRTREDQQRFARLQQLLSLTNLDDDSNAPLPRELSIDRIGGHPAPSEPAAAQRMAEQAQQVLLRPYKVFRRETPIATLALDLSAPVWGRGAISETVGPFQALDGRIFWFDFYPSVRLVPVYFAGDPRPGFLFHMRQLRLNLGDPLPLIQALRLLSRRQYNLAAGSIWVRADLFAAGGPAGGYVGLRIRGGRLAFVPPPLDADGKLTIPSGGNCAVELNFTPPAVAAGGGQAGIDAANANLDLPSTFTFVLSAGKAIVSQLANGRWTLYNRPIEFQWQQGSVPRYEPLLNSLIIPMTPSPSQLLVGAEASPLTTLAGEGEMMGAGWVLPVATIDVAQPPEADGAGGLGVLADEGLTLDWRGLRDGPIRLPSPWVVLFPGVILITDPQAENLYAHQRLLLWNDADSVFRSEIDLRYTDLFPVTYVASAAGAEVVLNQANVDARLDRPVDVKGTPFPIRALSSRFVLTYTDALQSAYIYDENIIVDNLGPNETWSGEAVSVAIRNALFTTTPVHSLLLFATLLDEEMVAQGTLFLGMGLFGLLPTLPDPYAANVGWLRRVSRSTRERRQVSQLLLAHVSWQKAPNDDPDNVETGFAFAPLGPGQLTTAVWTEAAVEQGARRDVASGQHDALNSLAFTGRQASPGQIWKGLFGRFAQEQFALLDVSSNADQMGVSFAWFDQRRLNEKDLVFYQIYGVQSVPAADPGFPLRVNDLDLSAESRFVRAFTLPQVSWEPLINVTKPDIALDPDLGFNFYPDDGGPTRIFNDSGAIVSIAPIPVSEFLVDDFAERAKGFTGALFTLPFGLRAFAEFSRENQFDKKLPGAAVERNRPEFTEKDLRGGLQIRVDAPQHSKMSASFKGSTVQESNIVMANGTPTGKATLGPTVSEIFNREFLAPTGLQPKGVPLTRIDFSGYGASVFSHWQNPNAVIAMTSQAFFDIFVGRTAHEVIQVRSLIYPWGIHVVRTITMFRSSSGYIYRFDTGWQAESDGKYDFSYKVFKTGSPTYDEGPRPNPYVFHPGVVKGVFKVRNIHETNDVPPFTDTWHKANGDTFIDTEGVAQPVVGSKTLDVKLQGVYFDADVEIEDVTTGAVDGRVPSRRMLGYVQIAPSGEPLSPLLFEKLLASQMGSLGGPVDCMVNVAHSGQMMRLSRVDVSSAHDGGTPVFVSAARGAVILPKEGSWSVVQHNQAGEVSPLAAEVTVPLIRRGALLASGSTAATVNDLFRLANPRDLLAISAESTHFGLLQSTGTQKALFRLPAFRNGSQVLNSAPPNFADAYRLVNSAGIFPNVADALQLTLGSFETQIIPEGYRFVNPAAIGTQFEQVLPPGPLFLINESFLKLYVEYALKDTKGAQLDDGKLNFGFDSAAQQWLSKVNDISMVVDLGSLQRLMIIRGKLDAQKGAAPAFKDPKLEFHEVLQPVIDILEILTRLQGDDYAGAFQKGLDVAMSNSADSWNYAFHARKDIPLVRFPPPLVSSATDPLRLEARLSLGVYFNEAFQVTSDPKQLVPSAGAFLEFAGSLSVMCVSLAAATIYAVGSVELRTEADIKSGPSLHMKFGFGAEISVGLPVVGTVSLLFMVGVQIDLDTGTIKVGAFLLFRGRAELAGGLVSITIQIEAKGTYIRSGSPARTDMAAQVTFGLDISIFLVINISFSESWEETRQIA